MPPAWTINGDLDGECCDPTMRTTSGSNIIPIMSGDEWTMGRWWWGMYRVTRFAEVGAAKRAHDENPHDTRNRSTTRRKKRDKTRWWRTRRREQGTRDEDEREDFTTKGDEDELETLSCLVSCVRSETPLFVFCRYAGIGSEPTSRVFQEKECTTKW